MQKQFVSTSTHILDPANPSTPPVRRSPPPEKDPLALDPNDKRSLYEKLNEVKAKKQEAFEEAYKFSNLIKRLDDTESDFLSRLQREQHKEEEEKKRVENEQIDAFRKAQGAIGDKPNVQDIAPPPPPPPVATTRRSSSLSKGNKSVLVKRKSESQGSGDNKRRRSSATESLRIESPSQQNATSASSISPPPRSQTAITATASSPNANSPTQNVEKKGGLAGFDDYSDSDSD